MIDKLTPYRLRRAEKREEDWKDRERLARTEFIGWLGFGILSPLEAWLLMLVIGALHGLTAGVPAIGYGTALLLTLGVDLAAWWLGRFRRTK
ncbi:hypothetical protein ACIGW0_31485 [Streptomyces bikiniensis]|uniref:Uncharacterized protein n=1 Tax=Streptomyces bikiniensis TaxID=1896 RepID=A0ABW8D1Y3_STRBI